MLRCCHGDEGPSASPLQIRSQSCGTLTLIGAQGIVSFTSSPPDVTGSRGLRMCRLISRQRERPEAPRDQLPDESGSKLAKTTNWVKNNFLHFPEASSSPGRWGGA